MPAETIEIDLKLANPTFFQDLDRRFATAAGKAGQALGGAGQGHPGGAAGLAQSAVSAFSGQSGITGALESVGSKGLSGAVGGGLGNLAVQALTGAISGAGQGIAQTPAGALNSGSVLAQNAEVGAVGGLIKNTIGQIPIIGDYINAKWGAFEEGIHKPAQATEGKLGAFYGELAARGINVSDAQIEKNARRSIAVERRRLGAERRVQKITEEVNAETAVSYSLSLNG